MKRGAKYRRISDDREGRELGVQRQDEDLDALAKRHGIEIVADYCDNDVSASVKARKDRPQYRQLLADAKAGKFDVILAYTSGRLTRRPREHEDLIDLATGHGIEYLYLRSPSFDLNTAQGRKVARMLAAQDTGEAEEIAERVQRAVKQRAAKGEPHGGPRGYGVTTDGTGVVEAEAEHIRRWAEHLLAGGTLAGLAAALNREGVPSATGAPWKAAVIRKILLAPRTAGLRIYEGVAYPAAHPAILDVDIWRAVGRVLTDPGRKLHDVGTARRHLGVHLYRCDRCDQTVNTAYAVGGNRLYRCHRCWRSWRADPIDDFIVRTAEGQLAKADRIARLLPAPAAGGPDLAALHAESAAIASGLQETARALTLARHGAVKASLGKAITEAEDRLAEIDRLVESASRVDPAAGVLTAKDPVKAFRALVDLHRRQAVIRALMEVRLGPPPRGRVVWQPTFMGPSRWTGDGRTWAEIWAESATRPESDTPM